MPRSWRTSSVLVLVALAAHGWAAGCSDLSGDCELNLDCPGIASSAAGGAAPDAGGGPADAGVGGDAATPDAGDAAPSAACHGLFAAGDCTTCLEGSCCAEIAACTADARCFACYTGQVGPAECHAPATEAALQGIIGCQGARCAEACVPKDTCNPITNDGCTVVGSACDLDGTGSFQCYPPPNDKALCESCAPTQGVYCAGGMFCLYGVGRCARYCCDDGDCGSGRCWLDAAALFGADLAVVGDEVGACVEKIPDGGTPKPACDAPDVAPSGGTCVVGHPPP